MKIFSRKKTKVLLIFLLIIGASNAQYWAAYNEWDRAVLYTHHQNLIEVALGKYRNKDLRATVDRGDLSGSNGVYYYSTNKKGPMTFSVLLGRDTIFTQEYYVYEFPDPCLCVSNPNFKKLEPKDFYAGVWSQNPINHYENLEIIEIGIEYSDYDNYTTSLVLDAEDLKYPKNKLQYVKSKQLYVNYMKFRNLDSSIATMKYPKVRYCESIGGRAKDLEREAQQMFMLKNENVIEIKKYPPFYAVFADENSARITKEQLLSQSEVLLKPAIGSNMFGFTIQEFKLRIMRFNGRLESYTSNSNYLTDKMKEALSTLKAGERIELGEIVAANSLKQISVTGVSFVIVNE